MQQKEDQPEGLHYKLKAFPLEQGSIDTWVTFQQKVMKEPTMQYPVYASFIVVFFNELFLG